MAEARAANAELALHWNAAYESKTTTRVGWFQASPAVSLELIDVLDTANGAPVIDIGGGASSLADHLIERGFTDLSVLDISDAALREARLRVGDDAPVSWLCDDLLSWVPKRRYALWHDRAVFHFLTDKADQQTYLDVLRSGISPVGAIVMATFAEDGPEYCSGLPVAGYSAEGLLEVLGTGFHVVTVGRELHTTPAGVVQPFTWVAAKAAP